MANAFNLTAQLNLRGPSNIRPIIGQMRKELGSLKADVKFNIDKGAVKSVDAIKGKVEALNIALVTAKANAKDLTTIFRDLQSSLSSTKGLNIGGGKSLATTAAAAKTATKNLKESTSAIEEFGEKSALAFKRFAAYTIATSGIFALVNAVNQGIKAFIEFERRLIQLRQVTGAGAVGIAGLEKEITNLAINLGVSSDSLAQVAITLAQAGLSANETRIALAALAKTDLAPSFDNLTDTTEGAIAALRQFGLEATDLEAVLGSINAVAAKFAVESGDIIAAIQRTGGVFASASKGVSQGKDALNEFIAVFTSVRATTRESAETIATGLRTIFTRIQRAKTIDQLKDFGVNLQDLEGKFVGPFEAVKRLSEALNQLDPRDIRFATIVEELGGFRQIGKVIPLIQQFATAQEALKVAQQGAGSLTEAQVLAQQSLANQIAKVREQFLALIRDVGKSTTFQVITKTVLTLTSGLISLAGAFKPILPILGILGTIKGISAISQFASGFFGLGGKGSGGGPDAGDTVAQAERERAEATNRASDVIRENTTAITGLTGAIQSLESSIKSRGSSTLSSGGRVLGFNRGGVVPGSGRGDKVPALLEPGEVVMSNRAVNKYGRGNLVSMNKYASGGSIKELVSTKPDLKRYFDTEQDKDLYNLVNIKRPIDKTSFKRTREQYRQRAEAIWQEASRILSSTGSLKDANNYIKTKTKINPGNYDAQELDPSNISPRRFNRIQGALTEQTTRTQTKGLKKLPNQAGADFVYRDSSGTNFVEVKNKIEATKDEDLISKALLGYAYINGKSPTYYKNNQLDKISGLNIELRSSNPLDIQKFMAGSVGGVMEETLPSDLEGLIKEIAKIGGTTALYDFVPKSEIEAILKEKKVFPRPTAKQLVSSPWLTATTPDLYGDRDKYIEPLKEVIKRARSRFNTKQSGIQAQLLRNVQAASGQGYKFGLASIYGPNGELGYSSTSNAKEIEGPDGTKYLTQIIRKSLPERYLDAVRGTSQDIAGVPARAAERLQYSDIFGTGGPLAFDFDETLVKGSDIPGKNPADYSDLNKVQEALKNAELTLLGKELQRRIDQYPQLLDGLRVLTARPQSNAPYLAATLARLGLPIPESKITGVSGGLNKVNNLSELETLIDDNLENVQSVMSGGKRAIAYSEPRQPDASSRSIQVMEGYALEEMVKSLGVNISPDDADPLRPIDYPSGLGSYARYWDMPPNIPTDTKRTNSSSAVNRLFDEAERFYAKNFAVGGLIKKYKEGSDGGVESDPLLDKLRKKKESGVFGKVGLRSSASEVTATYFKNATRSGMVTAKKLAGNIFSIGLSNATGGFGPYLYEVVMEKVTQLGSMLTPDRSMVSKDAQGFWEKAFGRSSIKKTPLPVEYWSSNSKLLDPKLYGKPETWPPPTDPAWILQSGYSKSPEFINSPDIIDMNDPKYATFIRQQQLQSLSRPTEQKPEPSLADFNPPGTYNATRGITYSTGGTIKRFASGGTVPAMVSNGEAFVPPKLAKKIGYAKLDKMNQADRNGMKGFAGGGVSVFKGPGSGTSDSIGPIGLPQGSYVIREKATKALRLNKGGIVGGVQAFMNGGVATPNERAASNIGRVIQTLEASGTGTKDAIERLEDIVANLLNETISSKDGIYETAQIIKELRANADKSSADQITTLSNIVNTIKSTGDFQSAAAEKQTQAIESFLARTKGQPGTAIVGQFPPPQPPSTQDVLQTVEEDRQRALENIAQAALSAGKGLEEFITDLESFYTTVKDNQIAKMQEQVGGPLTLSQTRQAAVTATAATEQYGGVQLGQFVINDFENLSSVIKQEIAARQESIKVENEARAQAEAAAQEYKNSGQAFQEFGTLGVAMPGKAQAFGQSGLGKRLLGEAQAFQKGPKALEGLNRVLDGLPGPVGNLVRSIGGLPGVISVAASSLGSDLLPQLGKLAGLSQSTGFAGLTGALAEGGSMAASLGTIGQQFAGPIAGMIGTIGGAVAGAISGFFKGVRTKTLENSLNSLGKSSEEARKALEKLSKTDSAENAQKASRAVGNLQANIDDLGVQAQRTTDERFNSGLSGAASGAAYAGIGATALLVATAPAVASTAAAAAAAVPALAGATSGLLGIGAALAPLSGGTTLAAAAAIVAVGAAIGAAYSYFSGPDAIDDEALKGQLESISQYIEGINQLGQRRLNVTTAEDIGRFLTDLQNASTQAEKFAVASRGAFVEEAQRAAINRQLGPNAIKDNQSVQDVTAGNAQAEAIARVAEERYYETLALDELNRVYKGNVDVIRQESQDKSKLIARGKELNLAQTESAAKQAALAKAALQVTRALEGFTDVFKRINAGIKRFSEESTQYIVDLESEVSTLLGDGKLQDVNRETERILANPAAYSVDEVRRAGAGVAGLAGGGPDAQRIGDMALASKLIEDRLPALLRGISKDTDGSSFVIDELEKLLSTAGIDSQTDAFQQVFKEITKSIDAVAGGGEGADIEATLLKDLIPQISQILEKGREVALNIQKEYNDTIQRTIDLQNKANTLLLKANEYERKAQQIRLQSNLDLQKAFGNVPTLEQMNQPFQANITGLTEGLIPGGSMDPAQIAQAIISSQQSISDREKALDQRRNAVGLLGAADTPAARQAAQQQIQANDAEQKAIAEQVRKTNEATQALETLANSGELASNALSALQERQKRVAGYTNFIDKLLTSQPEDRAQIVRQQQAANAVITGSATQGQFGNLQFRQEAMAGLSDLKDVLDPQEYRKILADFRIKSLEAAGVNVDRPSNLNGQSLRQLIEEAASGGAETPEAKAFQAAADAQSKAAAAMAEVNRVAAEKFMKGSDDLLTFFRSEFSGIVTKAFADVRGIEAEARSAATKPPEKPRELSPAERALASAEESAKKSASAAKRQTEERKAAEASWTLSYGAKENERRQEKDAIAVAAADQAEVQRLKAIVEAEQTARAAEESFRRSREHLDGILAAAEQRQADMGAPAPSSRLGGAPPPVDLSAAPTIASATSEAAQQQNAAATNLNTASTSLTDSAQNLNSVTAGMRASGGTAGTTADIPGARATAAAATTTIKNKEEIEQQLVLRLDEGTERFLGEFNTSLSTTFTTFGREFGSYITRLEQIKIPDKIEMTGRHTVDVRVTGAAGFDKLQDSMKNMIASAIKDKMSMIWKQSGGQYGERPG